jgi:hypothetical protein
MSEILPYYTASKWGTPLDIFRNFTMELDGGIGKLGPDEDDLDYQTYDTNLTPSQADGLQAEYLLVLTIYANVVNPMDIECNSEDVRAIPDGPAVQLTSGEMETERETTIRHCNQRFPLSLTAPTLPYYVASI